MLNSGDLKGAIAIICGSGLGGPERRTAFVVEANSQCCHPSKCSLCFYSLE